jgi:hypothetical protein
VLLQPGNNDASIKALHDYGEGKRFSFMTKDLSAVLHPVCFGAQKCRGNKVQLHSHLGKCFSGDYGINKTDITVVPMEITFMDNGGKFNSYYVNS